MQIKADQIETVCYSRYIVSVGNEKVPFTINLMGFKDQYFGIKATSFNKQELKENGVFFKINS